MTTLPAIATRPFPLPSDLMPPDRAKPWCRAILAAARSVFGNGDTPAEIARRTWPRDLAAHEILTRAARDPATTTTSGWASQLVETQSAGLVRAMGRGSAVAQLLDLAITVTASRPTSIPAISFSGASALTFTAEGGAIPALQGVSSNITLSPKKIAAIVGITRQLAELSDPAAEQLIRIMLSEHLASRLDSLMLDAVASSAVRPAGLRFGIAALTSATAGSESMATDIAALVQAVASVSGGDVVLVCAPAQWAALMTKIGTPLPFPVLYSGGLADGDVVAIAPAALAIAMDAEPLISVSDAAVVHFDDAPSQISTVGTPNVVAAPSLSLFQHDMIGIRIIWRASWGLRSASGLAHITAATWG